MVRESRTYCFITAIVGKIYGPMGCHLVRSGVKGVCYKLIVKVKTPNTRTFYHFCYVSCADADEY